jgi:hypothetical protein
MSREERTCSWRRAYDSLSRASTAEARSQAPSGGFRMQKHRQHRIILRPGGSGSTSWLGFSMRALLSATSCVKHRWKSCLFGQLTLCACFRALQTVETRKLPLALSSCSRSLNGSLEVLSMSRRSMALQSSSTLNGSREELMVFKCLGKTLEQQSSQVRPPTLKLTHPRNYYSIFNRLVHRLRKAGKIHKIYPLIQPTWTIRHFWLLSLSTRDDDHKTVCSL